MRLIHTGEIKLAARSTVLVALVGITAVNLPAQEHEHPRAAPEGTSQEHAAMMPGPLGIPQTREGSGTSWQPDLSPMYAHHRQAGRWNLMLHDNVFVQYLDDGSDRGQEQFGSINWLMGMARTDLAGGELGLQAMLSLEPLTVGECGYPDLLATGEFCDGEPIVDRQHPHDLVMELTARYQRPLSDGVAFQLYGGPVGEPALGPVAFPHRTSALPIPIAPVGHHWLDATHISFGVVTAGVYGRQWKIEGSVFNGREPDEDRYDFDLAPLDSYSGRVWFLPDDRWAVQVSAGRLNDAEPEHAGGEERLDITRTTASVGYHRPIGEPGFWSTTAAWGRNAEEEHATNAFLLESNLNLGTGNLFFGRLEAVEKSAEELVIPELGDEVFSVGKVTLGYIRAFGPFARMIPGIGAGLSMGLVPGELEPFYGLSAPVGFMAFLQLHPASMTTAAMPEMHHR